MPSTRTSPVKVLTRADARRCGRLLIGYCSLRGVELGFFASMSVFRWVDLPLLALAIATPVVFTRHYGAARFAMFTLGVLLLVDLSDVVQVVVPSFKPLYDLRVDYGAQLRCGAGSVLLLATGLVTLAALRMGLVGAFYTQSETCRLCDYNVSQSPNRCPECGNAIDPEILRTRRAIEAMSFLSEPPR